MKNIYLITFLIILLIGNTNLNAQQKSLYDFKVEDVDGNEFDFSKLKGKKVLIVNVASKCGLTPQYEQLQELYDEYKDTNFEIVAFPANNFASQEPGTNHEIKEFCSINFNITFPIMGKISVKGNDINPLYKWLTNKNENGVLDTEVSWNFQKFLINEKGELVKSISPKTNPKDSEIIEWITPIEPDIPNEPLNIGDIAPLFTLSNSLGEEISLESLTKKGNVILTWYRGDWCPYCNLALVELQEYISEFRRLGAELVSISPQLPDKSWTLKQKKDLEFTILSDLESNIAKKYGILFKVKSKKGALPIPATYIIDKTGTIRYAYINKDYTKRADPKKIVSFLEEF